MKQTPAEAIRSRITGHGTADPAALVANPRNWRTHPPEQRSALVAELDRVGWVQSVIVNRTTGHLVDGHLRVAVAAERGEASIPVVYVELSPEEEARVLVALDPLGSMAGTNDALLQDLLDTVDLENEALDRMLRGLLAPPAGARVVGPRLTDLFLVPPFSVLDTRQGYWRERKHEWLAMGIQSELGRGDSLLGFSDTVEAAFGSPAARRGRALEGPWKPEHDARPGAAKSLKGKEAQDPDYYRKRAKGRSFGEDLMRGERYQADLRSNVTGAPPLPDYADFGTANASPGTSVFDPVLCELAYRWWSPPGGQVLDPFAGGSVRGIVASVLGRRYHGIDLSGHQIDANRKQAADICPSNPPTWVQGDSAVALDDAPQGVDLLFSCPPYADLEVYSDDPADISNMSWPAFLAAYRAIIAKAAARLAPDRFAVWVTSDVRTPRGEYRNLPGETIRAFEDAGLVLYNEAILVNALGSLPMRAGRQFIASRKLGRTHQIVHVFLKGDGKRAAAACGPIEVPDVEA